MTECIFSYSELFGPFSCQHSGCGESAWSIKVSEEEFATLSIKHNDDRYEMSIGALAGMGVALCEDHLK